MRSAQFPDRTATFALVAMLFCAPLVPTTAGTTSRSSKPNQERLRPALDRFLQVRATASTNGVLVEWRTGFDPDSLGFNVYRVRNGARTQINPSLIAGGALVARRGQSYSWFDPQGTLSCEYYVETIDLRGAAVIDAKAAPLWVETLPPFQRSELLADLGSTGRTAIARPEWPDADLEKIESQNSAEAISTASLADQWAIANQPALKIGVRSNGWYHITQPQLAAAAFDTTGDAKSLRLFVAGNEIAMSVSRDSGPLSSTDFVEFWGEGLDTATTDTQVYWLVNGAQPGKRITIKEQLHTLDTGSQPRTSVNAIKNAASPFWFPGLRRLISTTEQPIQNEQRRETNPIWTSEDWTSVVSTRATRELSSIDENANNQNADNEVASTDSRPIAETSPRREDSPALAIKKSITEAKPGGSSAKRFIRRSSQRRRHLHDRSRLARRHNHLLFVQAPAPAFTYSAQRKARTVYYSAALNGEQENFFGPVVFGDGPLVTVALHNVESSSTAPAQLQVALQGVSFETHQIKVFVNGSLAGSISFVDESATTQTFTFPTSWLVEGDNIIKLAPVGSNHDTSVLDYLRITYPHSFHADNDALQFSIKSTQAPRIEGFTTPGIRVLEVTDTSAIQEVRPIMEASGGGFAATIPVGERGKARRLIAFPQTRLSQPAWVALNQPSSLNRSTNAADFVIIAHRDFLPALTPLVAQRQAQGFTVVVADIENVFDEFSYGVHTAQAIRDFMSLAKTTWARAPAYLLLIGDASYDPRNYSGAGNFDFVPSKQVDTGVASTSTAIETASDDWFTDFNGDGIADISVGRLPVRTAAEANLVVSKLVNYSPTNTPQSALLVADAQGSYYFNFEAADDQVGAVLPATMAIQKVYRRLQPSDADAHASIIANFNSGQAVTVYSGHGNVNIWGGSIFSSNDAAALTNGNRLPFVVVMDCLNGFFADPTLQGLTESLLKAPSGGAVASFASSGLTIPDGQHEMGLRMFQLLYSGPSISIGDASRQAKFATTDMDVRRTWILFGDPSMKVR